MTLWLDETLFNDQICARIRQLRIDKDWTQAQMAAAIGVPVERYKKYETRSPLPAYLIPRFAMIVDRPMSYVLTGKDDPFLRGPRIHSQART